VHVQKEGHHTWVKELPVTSHRVTEAQAFNMPLTPQVRVVSAFVTATGSAVVRTPLPYASTTNDFVATTTKATTTFAINPEYQALISVWGTTTGTTTKNRTLIERVQEELTGTTTEGGVEPTSTIESGGVRLSRDVDGEVYAEWVGGFEQMPYYYCAASFPRYEAGSTSVSVVSPRGQESQVASLGNVGVQGEELIHPVQQVDTDIPCDRRIRLDAGEEIHAFDFFPQSTDFVVVELNSGIYMMEIDARAWQNKQPLLQGENLRMHVENGTIFVYDGSLIYQIVLN
jgi:hypothetical protein